MLQQQEKNGWIRAIDLNNDEGYMIDDGRGLHAGLSTKILNKIVVENCNSSCEYENRGTITITLQNIKLWVDPVTGTWFAPEPVPGV